MRIDRLDIAGLRCLQKVRIAPTAGVNMFVGANGAGKTTVLEALHLLGFGRSFRAGPRDAVIARGTSDSVIFAEVVDSLHGQHRVGLRRGASDWAARVDDSDVVGLLELFRFCPVVCFEPGTHALIAGPGELRRAFLDWSVFHVEPDFLSIWRNHQRALRQRNAGLKAQWSDALLIPWERELAQTAVEIMGYRGRALEGLRQAAMVKSAAFLPELGTLNLQGQTGFGDRPSDSPEAVVATYAETRNGDRERGFTRFGVHRGEWSLSFAGAPRREHLSRGQEKLAALIMVLAQVEHFRAINQHWPILLLDDLGSELDADHLGRVLDWVRASEIQAWITGTEVPADLSRFAGTWSLFHVEQGRITPA